MTDTGQKTAVLLVQLGTPDEATPQAVRRYLKEFLSDPHVVDLNRILWFFILNGIILTFRPRKSALLYERFFSTYGPTLRTYTKSLTTKLNQITNPQKFTMFFAMRYGNPNLTQELLKIGNTRSFEQLLVVPLFPQYSNTTTGSVKDRILDLVKSLKLSLPIRFIDDFYKHPLYIESLARSINEGLQSRHKPAEKLVLSYHGIPERYVTQGDPYACMCLDTTDLLKTKINFPAENIIHCYQSRFGKEPWLQPYTDETVEKLAKEGIKEISVACPSFTMDCLETLDEIAIENQHVFHEYGGTHLQLISCLNDAGHWCQNLAKIIEEYANNAAS